MAALDVVEAGGDDARLHVVLCLCSCQCQPEMVRMPYR